MDTWDYIVVGAGSAGCVVARRLSDMKNVTILLLEAGPRPASFWIDTPAGMASLFLSEKYNWKYHTEAVPALNNRKIYWPRGKVLGGSSAINGMVYTRGNKRDYDFWSQLGNTGWSWEEVLPYFKKAEDNKKGGNAHRGVGGPLSVSDPAVSLPTVHDFITAASSLDIHETEDLSTCGEDGVGILQATILNGKRNSAYDAYIRPIEKRENLEIRTEAEVRRILLNEQRATGVEILHKGKLLQLHCKHEVIVSAGALASPHILMLSGLGDGTALQQSGIQTTQHLPGVGKNLQDHCSVHVKVETGESNSYNKNLRGWRKYLEGIKYLTTHSGYLALGSSQAAAFIKSHNSVEYSDLEISFRPMTFSFNDNGQADIDPYNAISASIYRVRPSSRGEILLNRENPKEKPLFYPNYLHTEDDRSAMINGIRRARQIFESKPISEYILTEIAPGANITTDQQISDFIDANAKCAYHPVGTCKMGSDNLSVVDSRLRVNGIQGLRVIDASIMPIITSGNTNAPSIMIGEKGASMIIEDFNRAN